MSDNITLTKITRESGAYVAGTTFETEQQVGGEHRPVVKVGESALPDGAATQATLQDVLDNLESIISAKVLIRFYWYEDLGV